MTPRLAGRRYLHWHERRLVSSYKAMLYLGCVFGVYAGTAVAVSDGLDGSRFAWTTMALLVPAFIGARLWFVVRGDHSDVAAEGGAALYGGLALGVVCSVPLLALLGVPFFAFWDAACITLLVGLIVTRVGCLMNGCCAGRTTDGRLGAWLPNVRGEWRRRYPTQMLESGWATLVLVGVLAERDRLAFTGERFIAVVLGYSAGRLFFEAMREESWLWHVAASPSES